MTAPTAPAEGWTLAEAAAALLPDLYRQAAKAPPENWWMAGGTEAHKAKQDALRLAFGRLMEGGSYAADGVPDGDTVPSLIPPLIWRAAQFQLGFPGEPALAAELVAGWQCWRGVRIKTAGDVAPAGQLWVRPDTAGDAWWTCEQALAWVAFGQASRWEEAREAMGIPDGEAARAHLPDAQRRLSAAIAARKLPAWGQETAGIGDRPKRDTLERVPPEDFAGPSALVVQINGWACPPSDYPHHYRGRWWQGMRFEPADVRAEFPAATDAEVARAIAPEQAGTSAILAVRSEPKKPYSPNALGGWFVLRVSTWPKDAPLPSEPECHAAARSYFDRVPGRDKFRVIRTAKTPESWRKRGPKERR